MTVKIAHISDTHIRTLKFHEEYRMVFEQIYSKLRDLKPDFIVHTGDLNHSKLNLSPESVELASEFLRSLTSIAPTYLILGNHDFLITNSERQDAVTPIVEALALPNLHLLKDSQFVYPMPGVRLNVLSLVDKEKWQTCPADENINIVLFHGVIKNMKNDDGFILDRGEDESIFENADYGFLGDIHKTNQFVDEEGRIRYSGASIQQNHGEHNDKGFLFWELEDKETFKCEHFVFSHPIPFVTVELTPKGRIPKGTTMPPNAQLRLKADSSFSFNVIQRAIEVATARFSPKSVSFFNKALTESNKNKNLANQIFDADLRSQSVQEDLIKQYLKDYNLSEETFAEIFKLNEKYNKEIGTQDEVYRNIRWRLKSVEWDNLFNYTKGNKINFDKTKGIVGIFGKSYSGKSSVVDSILYTIFNSISKNSRKNYNIINQNKRWGSGAVKIEIGEDTYSIERRSEKYEKKLHGVVTNESKTEVLFKKVGSDGEETSLNGESRNDTDHEIRKIFGVIEDFLLTSMSSQFGSLNFIGEGSTRRKEILAKYLDLEVFDKKFKIAKEDAQEVKAVLKKYVDWNAAEEIESGEESLSIKEAALRAQEDKCETLNREIEENEEVFKMLIKKIESMPTEKLDISFYENEKKKLLEQKVECSEKLTDIKSRLKDKEDTLRDINEFFTNTFNIDDYREKQKEILFFKSEVERLEYHADSLEHKVSRFAQRTKLLEEVPCGPEYSSCKLLKDAYDAKELTVELLKDLAEEKILLEQQKKSLMDKEPARVAKYLENYDSLRNRKSKLELEISQLETGAVVINSEIMSVEMELERVQDKIFEYDKNKEVIENFERLESEREAQGKKISSLRSAWKDCNALLLTTHKQVAVSDQQLNDLREKKKYVEGLRKEYEAYDLFLKCMHGNGISYDVISKKLPVLNEEIAKILANVVQFEVFFENDGKQLNIFIKHPKYDPRPLELCSGAEKTLAALAMRLALMKVSNLPISNMFILDEPAVGLDVDRMDGFLTILELLKENFEIIILISHLDTLKDVADCTINIEKKGKFAFVNQ